MAQLGGLQEHIAEIRAKGGDVIALSADDQQRLRDGLPDAAALASAWHALNDAVHAYDEAHDTTGDWEQRLSPATGFCRRDIS